MRRVCCCVVVILLVGCGGLKVGHEFDPDADFEGFQSFAWLAQPALVSVVPQAVRPDLESLVKAAAMRQLEAKGLRYEPDRAEADLAILFTLGSRSTVFTEQRAFEPGSGWSDEARGIRDYSVGALSVDVYDVRARERVWHAWATKSISGADQANAPGLINRTVERLFENFPP